MKTITGYKFIKDDMHSLKGDLGVWKLGVWKKHDGELELCESGLHGCETPLQSLEYINGGRWFAIEARGEILYGDDKFTASEMRLVREINVKQVLVRFAIICARESLQYFEKVYKDDKRPRQAIEAAENYLKNPSPAAESAARSAESAARSAESAARSARSAAESAARSAARSAWSAARSAESAAEESAAWSAARSAESAAEESAAWSAARSAESAARSAWSAARSAESAARSAESAAWSAWSAARSAARSAAWSAARKWQNERLLELIEEDALKK